MKSFFFPFTDNSSSSPPRPRDPDWRRNLRPRDPLEVSRPSTQKNHTNRHNSIFKTCPMWKGIQYQPGPIVISTSLVLPWRKVKIWAISIFGNELTKGQPWFMYDQIWVPFPPPSMMSLPPWTCFYNTHLGKNPPLLTLWMAPIGKNQNVCHLWRHSLGDLGWTWETHYCPPLYNGGNFLDFFDRNGHVCWWCHLVLCMNNC